MNRRSHGVLSLSLLFGALVVGLVSVFHESAAMGAVYAVIIPLALLTITYSYCGKCSCRLDSCGHVFPARLSRLLPPRTDTNYTYLDLAGVVLPFALLVGFPQWWLFENKVLFAVFWALIVIGLLEIRLFVCRGCSNEKCALRTRQDR